ncbi:hypothetical protein [Dokdonia sp.]|uniref:hypothetical protein n=1 Tax=Dokdonia sp. TaxID=2024995 RepID=UPI003265DF25
MITTLAIIEDSFKITGIGILLELKHNQLGLAESTKLISEKSGKIWIIKTRVLFDHAVDEQQIFKIESTNYMHLNFRSVEKKQASIERVKERESNNIYQYLVEPIDHNEKPEQGEKLKINYP